ncbi:HK97-gp10 family putative phage morphogenesis protein [Martelella mangrovi]|uniref:HK97 gp10 family phage protein n=1 Tax=Martelella mangrovi TaxID=1397477 RepID=A0ABV2IFV3_9HYPH
MARKTTVLGRAKLQKKLDRLPKVAKTMIRDAMAEQADDIVRMMKSLVPVDNGDLRDSIGWTWGRNVPKGATVVAAVKQSLGGDLTITVYAGNEKAYYARWIEFGTVKMKAQPYFYVSWRANQKNAKRKIRKATRNAAKRVAKGG